ncbi:hypothetical protein CFC21_021878 [Triticum aestivum]|uniref:HTH myb-type domain-containing protein n=2 Tax=Triticum aestivum TaxID=4565 RepID=A0A9R1J791_WHEAT|nr:hypothetical protein CFC21_021878 [Triticum aestivum]
MSAAIEGMKSQMGGAASEETVSDHDGPVLEEFIPLKPSLSLSSSDDETSTHAAAPVSNAKAETPPPTPETKKAMPDWLQSAQLSTWSEPQQSSSLRKVLPCRPVALNATRTGGAFHPFEKEKQPEAELPASSTTAPASSALVGDSGDKATSDTEVHDKDSKDITEKDTDKDKDKEGQSQPNRKPRRCWAPELHRRFLEALQQLGGSYVATPKQIRELMKVDGLTNDEVKSHLQKYRLHTSRRPSSTAQSSAAAATQPTPQFVVVGSCIWVPQQEYAAAAAAAAATNVASGSPNQVYAPTATLPSGLKPHLAKQSSRRSEGPRSGDTGGVNSDSDNPTMSSSSQTTSAGHP